MEHTPIILNGSVTQMLRTLPGKSIHTCVTSPPYYGLRDYGTDPVVFGGKEGCQHDWADERFYTEQTAAKGSADAFSKPGEANAARLKEGRWREESMCRFCGAWKGHLGLEKTPELFTQHLVEIFHEVYRVLRDDGTCWVNLGDSYSAVGKSGGGDQGKRWGDHGADFTGPKQGKWRPAPPGLKPKELVGIPWRVAFALQADGWYLRQDIIWHKPNPMPESVRDRCTKAHEYIFLLTKKEKYFFDAEAIKEPAVYAGTDRLSVKRGGFAGKTNEMEGREAFRTLRNKRSVWTVTSKPFKGAHFATFPPNLIEPCILAGASEGGCCGVCGVPRERILEVGEPDLEHQRACGGDASGDYDGKATKDYAAAGAQDASATKARILAGMREKKTIGWAAGCKCEAPVVPCTVLDPFAGSGTTGQVTLQHGRKAVLIELNPAYIPLIEKRCGIQNSTEMKEAA